MTDQARTPSKADDVAALVALIEAGGFWRLTPEWWPRDVDRSPDPATLRAVEAGLRRLL
ncbi:hypothetical protein [Streptomyces sp. NPDC057910]|uniref:hypothetical protein n=1 Tax=Streptomyces sp. NPDC057910 TaxID=3346278 RepID=UPI0036F0111B